MNDFPIRLLESRGFIFIVRGLLIPDSTKTVELLLHDKCMAL